MTRITHVRVENLLDYFDHTIYFPAQWHYILLYGPNGVGKTKLLELIYAVYSRDFAAAASIPFKRLIIEHENGLRTLYGHASLLNVSRGQWVTQGETIAWVGSTGYSYGNHLHFEVIKDGKRVNPKPFIDWD